MMVYSGLNINSPARTRTSDLVVTLNPILLPEVDYLFTADFTLR